jgi:uncharacterized protein
MRKLALITGATSGIGLELACEHARHGGDLILVAKNEIKLAELQQKIQKEHQVTVQTMTIDLAEAGAASLVYERVQQLGARVDYLINNAGFGLYGWFTETDWETEARMIQLNVVTLTELTKRFAQMMKGQGGGRIMNVASIAAFMPGPAMAVYFATKTFVLSLSEAVNNELAGTGVKVTALCPGPTESRFQEVAAMEDSPLVQGQKLPSAKEVAEYGYQAMRQGQAVAVHGWRNRLLVWSLRWLPRAMVVKIIRNVQAPTK